jgi:phosphoenolpyruvate synthase (EC 2.7.9.2)
MVEPGVADGGDKSNNSSESNEGDSVALSGLGASPGTVSGEAKIIDKLDGLDKVSDGDVIVAKMTTPDMVPAMKRASGIVTDEGGMTSHAAIVSRELGVPAVVGAGGATASLQDGQLITVDGEKGSIETGATASEDEDNTTAIPTPSRRSGPKHRSNQ